MPSEPARFQVAVERRRGHNLLPVPPLASIPSPSSGVVDIGPLHIHMYGLMLLLAIAACILLTGYRWTRLGGDWDLVLRVAVWGVAVGIVGARLYHDLTSWNEVPERVVGPVRRLAGRPRRLGRDLLRLPRRRDRHPPLRARACGSSPTPSRPAC